MKKLRPPAVADRFYPADPAALQSIIQDYVDSAKGNHWDPKALIVPHAGYIYSGPVAGNGYAQLQNVKGRIRRVVLLGPAHYVPVRGLAFSSAEAFQTPLGPVPIDQRAREILQDLPQVQILDEAHAPEHSLEVQLPFLQETLGQFSVVPLLVGKAPPEEVAQVIEKLWGGPETLFVVSSDLSHFHDYETARELDEKTADWIEQICLENLDSRCACGYKPITGLLQVARKRGLSVKRLDLRNSGDASGNRQKVVGYGAFVVSSETAPPKIATEHRRLLLQAALQSLRHGLRTGKEIKVDVSRFPKEFQQKRATFVTLKIEDELRGCMGSLSVKNQLIADVAHNAWSAAFRDPRFQPLQQKEFDQLHMQISVLSSPQPIAFSSEEDLLEQIRPGLDGLTLYEGNSKGTFLPSVWEKIPDPRIFFAHLKKKAGLPSDYWSESLQVERYTVESFGQTIVGDLPN